MSSFLSHQQARNSIVLTIGVISPFILRTIGDWTVSFVLEKCCKLDKMELSGHLIGMGDSEVTIEKVWDGKITWKEARENLGLRNNRAAILIASIRLLFWHWLQPFLYFYVLFAYWDLLVHIQRVFGLIVCGREGLYWIMTIIAAITNPVYLLVDLRSTWKHAGQWWEKMFFIGSYVIAPEKYVATALLRGTGGNAAFFCFVAIFLPLLDLGGVAACVTAVLVDQVYAPLMVGYVITTVGGVFIVFTVLYRLCYDYCCCC